MRCRFWNLRTVLAPVATLIVASCASVGESETGWIDLKPDAAESVPMLHITGTVHHLNLEGGVFVIRDATGTNYNPTNLPEAFRVDGMAVEAEARRRDDMASIGMVGPIVELLRIRQRLDSGAGTPGLSGTAWRLEDLAGAGVMDSVQATLEFFEDGTVSGNGSCNQFRGTVTVSDGGVTFSPLATTRKMCVEAVMHQENRYLTALREAQRFEIKGPFLYIHTAGQPQPLRFIGADESGSRRQ